MCINLTCKQKCTNFTSSSSSLSFRAKKKLGAKECKSTQTENDEVAASGNCWARKKYSIHTGMLTAKVLKSETAKCNPLQPYTVYALYFPCGKYFFPMDLQKRCLRFGDFIEKWNSPSVLHWRKKYGFSQVDEKTRIYIMMCWISILRDNISTE